MTKSNLQIRFTVLTLFPELIQNYIADALISKAIVKNLFQVNVISLRDFTEGRYKSVDDVPYGGGDGMLLKASVLESAVESVLKNNNAARKVIYLSPQGEIWNNQLAKAMATNWLDRDENKNSDGEVIQEIILVCGRYAGIDQRFINKYVTQEISIGDYILSGGELAALVLIESISRFIPGVLGDGQSAFSDSFADDLLEAPQFTKPQCWADMNVPDVLVSGHHLNISEWKKFCSLLVTYKKRPDLFTRFFSQQTITMPQLQKFYRSLSESEKKVLQIENIEI